MRLLLLLSLVTLSLPAHATLSLHLHPPHDHSLDKKFYRFNYIYFTPDYSIQDTFLNNCLINNKLYSEEVPKDNLKFKGDLFSKDVFGNVQQPSDYKTIYYCN